MFAFQDKRESVEVAFTDRFGGTSAGLFSGSRADASPGRLRLMRQVHGADVVVLDGTESGDDPAADALVTRTPGLVLATRAADCVPILIADVGRGLVSAVHAGRAGVFAGVVPEAVKTLRSLGAEELTAWVGPRICGRCYEVPADLRDEVAAGVPETWSETSWGTPALDLAAGVRAQLDQAGAEVIVFDRCTFEDPTFNSYRREPDDPGRHAGLIWVSR